MKDKFNNAIGPQVRTPKVGASKILPFLAAASLLGGLQTATQFFAQSLQYHAALGPSFHNLYAPWAILTWAGKWYSDSPEAFMRAGGFGITVATVSLLALTITKMVQINSAKINPFLHGSARWANKKDIQDAGLLQRPTKKIDALLGRHAAGQEGVYVGAWLDKKGKLHYLRHNGPEHVLTYAPTRSGKGVGLVIPTLLSWPHSALITDLKGELWALTAGWRKQHAGNKVLRFEPTTLKGSVRWNPLDEIRISTEFEVGDVQNLATLIVDPDGKGLESHWHKTSQALLVGIILHALYKAKNEGTTASLPEVDAMLADTNKPIEELWMEMTTYAHVNGHVHPVVGASARDMMDRPEEEAGSVLSTAKSYLALYRDPVVAHNVARSEFSIKDLMNYDDPVSLYIVTTPNDKPRLRPLVRILINMVVRLLAGKVEFEHIQSEVRFKKTYKHRLLGMLELAPENWTGS